MELEIKEKEEILGYQLSNNTAVSIVVEIMQRLEANNCCESSWLACFNPHSYYIACHEKQFSLALKSADWLIADGVGVLIASRILGQKIRIRLTGSDIFYRLHEKLNQHEKYSVFFLGSTEDNLKKIVIKMAKDYPNIRVAGIYSPPFKPQYSDSELGYMISLINDSKADVLWVGMTAPKQEKWIHENINRLNVRFVAAIGAVFDFYTGEVKRSNITFQKIGLEWLPRLIQQPIRLWRRTFISAPFFLWHTIIKRFKRSSR